MANQIKEQENLRRAKVLACATVIEEMKPILPLNIDSEVLDFGLHLTPDKLKSTLQQAIDSNSKEYDTIILGYGLCSLAVVGLVANNCTLVIPKVDDCIAIFLGSADEYDRQSKKEPGTYYLTKGWIEVSDTLLDEYKKAVDQFGQVKAEKIMSIMLKNYKRLVYIDTGLADQNGYQFFARATAEKFNLRFERVEGSNSLVKKMLFGPWDKEILVVPPGGTIKYVDFRS
jgi:hypothetical protein